jgi:hypothetical protein
MLVASSGLICGCVDHLLVDPQFITLGGFLSPQHSVSSGRG